MGLKIEALHIGTLLGNSKAAVTYQRGYFEKVEIPILMFVITGGEQVIVVDTGTCGVEGAQERHAKELRRPESQDPLAVLDEIGLDPAAVGTVVNTHLHWDHCANNDLFPNANVLVQKSELDFAIAPPEPNAKVYERRPGLTPDWMKAIGQISAVTGDVPIAPGVRLVHLPGHSPGSQGVLVTTDDGDYLIAGDCVSCYENWQGDELARHIPAAFTSLTDYMDSFAKIERLACEIIPSHDPLVVKQRHFG